MFHQLRPSTLKRAREIALRTGLRYVYTGNVHDETGQSTYCHGCGARPISDSRQSLVIWGMSAYKPPAPNAWLPSILLIVLRR